MEDVYMVFNDDSSGLDIYIEEDEYSVEMYSDTAFYAWWLEMSAVAPHYYVHPILSWARVKT